MSSSNRTHYSRVAGSSGTEDRFSPKTEKRAAVLASLVAIFAAAVIGVRAFNDTQISPDTHYRTFSVTHIEEIPPQAEGGRVLTNLGPLFASAAVLPEVQVGTNNCVVKDEESSGTKGRVMACKDESSFISRVTWGIAQAFRR